MKLKQKLFSYLLVFCLVTFNTVGIMPLTANAEEIITESVTLEDVLAGIAEPSQLGGITTRTLAAGTLVEDGIYYVNSKYSGDYLRNSSSAPIPESGLFSSLGSSIQWQITNVSDSIALQSVTDSSKYLAVPTSSTSSSSVQLVTVEGTTIPTECLWNISIAEGGCLLQNVYNSRYLYTYGTSLFTSSSLGSSGSSTYNARVWRIGALSYITGKELNQSADFGTLVLTVGSTGSPSITKSPSNAIWATASDFNYSRKVTSYVTESNGVFSGNSSGITAVVATHKVTDLEFVFAVVVGTQPTYTISNYIDQGYRARSGGLSDTVTYTSVVQTKFEHFFALNSTIQSILYTSSADTCKIDQFDSVTSDNLISSCPHSVSHLTRTTLRDGMGNGTNINSRVLWTGHILAGNPSSASWSDTYSVIITPKHTTTGSTYTNKSDSEVRKESIFTLMHELSHQLGAPDHYCYGIASGESVCLNQDCDICYMGETSARDCMMSYRYDVETESESTLYCSSCLADISNHLSEHHQ